MAEGVFADPRQRGPVGSDKGMYVSSRLNSRLVGLSRGMLKREARDSKWGLKLLASDTIPAVPVPRKRKRGQENEQGSVFNSERVHESDDSCPRAF